MAAQADGKTVVVGTFQGFMNGDNVEDFALAGSNKDGSLDRSFGVDGEVLTDFGPTPSRARRASPSLRRANRRRGTGHDRRYR